jgi:hypothetical protein
LFLFFIWLDALSAFVCQDTSKSRQKTISWRVINGKAKKLGDGQNLKPDFIGFFTADWTPEWMTAFGRECVKTPGQTLAMISENFIAREPHETVYPG